MRREYMAAGFPVSIWVYDDFCVRQQTCKVLRFPSNCLPKTAFSACQPIHAPDLSPMASDDTARVATVFLKKSCVCSMTSPTRVCGIAGGSRCDQGGSIGSETSSNRQFPPRLISVLPFQRVECRQMGESRASGLAGDVFSNYHQVAPKTNS